MEEKNVFQAKLSEALASYHSWLTSSELPRLHDLVRIQKTTLDAVYELLLKKAVLREDPYKYETKISEIEAPSTAEFSDSERTDVIGVRLSEYLMMLDFLNNSYQFSVEFLDLQRISRISALFKTFHWKEITPTSTSPNSRGLAAAVAVVKSGNDVLSGNVLTDNLARVAKDIVPIQQILNNLTMYHREFFKFNLREKCADAVYAPYNEPAAFFRAVKKAAAAAFPGQLFYPELAEEIYDELYSPNAEKLQQALLEKLFTSAKPEADKKASVDMKSILLDAIRSLGGLGAQLEEVVKKIDDNKRTLDSHNSGIAFRLKKILCQAFGIKEKPFIMEVETKDPANQRILRYTVPYAPFADDLRRRARLYTAFIVRTSGSYKKIEQSTEAQILKFLVQQIEELQVIFKKLQGIDAYFKTRISTAAGDKAYGLRVEIATMKNTLINVNQKRFEYTSLIEEQQQLEKLGILKS